MERSKNPPRGWDSYYARTIELPPPERTVVFLENIPQGGRVLDFGAGSGRWSAAFLRDRPDLTIDALDQHIEDAALLPAGWRGDKIQSAFQDFMPTKSYNGIWANAALFFLEKDELYPCFHKLASALKENGTIMFTLVDDCHAARAAKYHGLSKAAIQEMLKSEGLEEISLKLREDTRYGDEQNAIPTYFVTAKKPKS